jgi:RNA polymerase sigma-70 factor (ECF subfamily)
MEKRTADRASAPPAWGAEGDALLQRYIDTWQRGDLAGFTALLAEDATLSMPPLSLWFAGRDVISQFLATVLPAWPTQYRLVPGRANGTGAVAVYRQSTVGSRHEAAALTLIDVRGERIAELIRFGTPTLFRSFGLPEQLPLAASPPVVSLNVS